MWMDIFICILLIIIILMLFVLYVTSKQKKLISIGFFISSIYYFFGIYKFNFLKSTPIALKKIFENLDYGILVLDNENNIINFNKETTKILEKLNQMNFNTLDIEDLFEDNKEILEKIKKDINYFDEEYYSKRKKEYYKISISTMYENNYKIGKLIVLNNITNQKKLLMFLNDLACKDELTNLFNRRCFYEQYEEEIKKSKQTKDPLSLIMIDIDYFKIINDTYGHHIGDEVLKYISNICKSSIRPCDIIARYGGEEFAILLPNCKQENAVDRAEMLRLNIYNSTCKINDLSIKVTASFGVSAIDYEKKEQLCDILIRADRALYRAKEEGRNKVVVYSKSY